MEWLTIPPILTPQARWYLGWLALDIRIEETNATLEAIYGSNRGPFDRELLNLYARD